MFFCPVLFAGFDANTFFLAQSGLCVQRGSDHSVPFLQEKLDSDPYFVLNSCSAQTVTRIGLLEEIPRSGVQIPCLS